jgi:LacI family transcriptional regulator
MLSRQVDGLILATAILKDRAITALASRNIPTVMVNRRDAQDQTSSVISDDERGIALAVEHLVSLGHRDICHIGGPQNLSTGATRLHGFVKAMKDHDLKVPDTHVEVAASYSRADGARAAHQLFAKARRPTAIVAANDLLALGCYDALRSAGIRCPADTSITGYNDMPLVDLVSPPLTTVRIEHHQMGIEAAGLLLRKLAEPASPTVDIVLRPTLILRESTAAPRTRKRRD